jgi:methyl-accepting chemotaxis protein
MGWAETVTALSTALIAVMLSVVCVVLILLLRTLTKTFNKDGKPAIESFRAMVDDATAVVGTVKGEVEGLADTSKGIRKRAERAATSIEDRLRDIETLVDVVQEEVEDTALDVAAALRTTRRGGKLFKRMKRALLRRGRRH